MIDSLVRLLPVAMQCPRNGFPEPYALVTLHRPSNVDDSASLRSILKSLLEVNEQLEVVFPVHPRTGQRIEQFGLNIENLHLLDPLPYIEFLSLQNHAAVVITDSGGIQEETTYLGVPCLTLRTNTERPVTGSMDTNVLVGQDLELLKSELARILEGKPRRDRYRHCGTGTRGRGSLKSCIHKRGISLTSPFRDAADGNPIIPSPTPVERYELKVMGRQINMISSDPGASVGTGALGPLQTDMGRFLASALSNSGARNS